MQPALRTATAILSSSQRLVINMSGRYAFALCMSGRFTIRILNVEYTVTKNCIFACMPFVNIEVADVEEQSEIIFGTIRIEDVPSMINRWINTENLSAIQNCPMIELTATQAQRLTAEMKDYEAECEEEAQVGAGRIRHLIQRDIIDLHGRLIVSRVLNLYFSIIAMGPVVHDRRDEVFQRFMISLYANFREHRDVRFYATASGVSLKYFSTVVRRVSGSSPSEWIETVVAGEAKSLLDDSTRSVKGIAAALNFPDAPTFTKYFRRVTGTTPKAYRKNQK